MRGVSLSASVERLAHILQSISDRFEILGTIKASFFKMIKQALTVISVATL
jgi:hypothetical protein